MTGVIVRHTLRRGRRGMLIWGVALGLMFMSQSTFIQDSEAFRRISELYETLPPFLISMMGGDAEFLATPEGYLASQVFSFSLIIYGVYALFAGLNVTANEEDRNITDMLLSQPVTRTQFMLEKLIAQALLCVGVVVLATIGIVAGVLITPVLAERVDNARLVAASLGSIPGVLVVLGFTAFVGGIFRRRGTALGVAAAFLVGSYVLQTLAAGTANEALAAIAQFSFFRYSDGISMVRNGIDGLNLLILVGATAVFVVLGIGGFNRRDVGV